MSGKLRALLVEDSRDDAYFVLRALKKQGLSVESEGVETEEAMAAALDREPWDVILSDYSLPGFSAPAALDLLHGRGLDVPFIVISGTVGEELAVETMKAGAHDYFRKGHLTKLRVAIQREVQDARNRRESD